MLSIVRFFRTVQKTNVILVAYLLGISFINIVCIGIPSLIHKVIKIFCQYQSATI